MTQDKWLFTPGPLTTSSTVKQAQLHDYGSRDALFINTVAQIRKQLQLLAGVTAGATHTAVLIPGNGTSAIESVISSVMRADDHLLIIINGAYGRRVQKMATVYHIPFDTLTYPENTIPDVAELDAYLTLHPEVKLVAMVHCETTTGILNPVEDIAAVVNKHHRQLFVDAMSSFGAVPLNVVEHKITYLVSSANKCLEGVPGFAFVIADVAALTQTEGHARTLSLDLYSQWQGLEQNGQFRFTPPVQSIMAFHQALVELNEEGGVMGRAKRYAANNHHLRDGMIKRGFQPYLAEIHQSYIITTFFYPTHPNFNFDRFYHLLSEQGFIIYPGKLTEADCFRLGNIGRLTVQHMEALLTAIDVTLESLGVTLPEPSHR